MTVRSLVFVLVGVLVARPVSGQRLADLPPVYVAHPYLAPAQWKQCTLVTRGAWALGGATIGVMASFMVIGILAGDGGPSAAHRRQTALIMSGGALVGGVYGWFALADRYSCG